MCFFYVLGQLLEYSYCFGVLLSFAVLLYLYSEQINDDDDDCGCFIVM